MQESIELDAATCAKIALYMHGEYQKAMQPPLFMVLSFEEWLAKIIAKSEGGQ